MKKCKICGSWPVFTGDGFCKKHHVLYVKTEREFRANFIAFMKLKELCKEKKQ